MIRLDIFTQIEKAVLARIDKFIRANPEAVSGFAANRNNERASDVASVNVAIVGGDVGRVTISHCAMILTIEILVVSNNPRNEEGRRDDLYPVLFAVVNILAGARLKDEDGRELPIDVIRPEGKWGQVSKTGEQLAYTLNFKTALNFPCFQEEDGEEIRGFFLDYYMRESKTASDKLDLETEEKKE